MDPATIANLPDLISSPRLGTYLQATASQGEALRLYTWNIEASSAVWSELHAFEVIVRNTMHDTLATGLARPDWWNHSRVAFHQIGKDQLSKAQDDAAKSCQRKRRTMLPEDVVASLSLGFWTGLVGLGSTHQYETLFWQPHLRKAFPGYSGQRGKLSSDLESIRLLRNRIAHHEPIFGRNLWGDHLRIVRVASYIDADAATYIDTQSRVDSVLQKRDGCVRLGIGTSF